MRFAKACAERSTPYGQLNDVAILRKARVMRAAWAIHRDGALDFRSALQTAWNYELSRSATALAENAKAQVEAVIGELFGAYPVEDYRVNMQSARDILSNIAQRLIDVLDDLEGDADFEYGFDDEPDERSSPRSLSPHPERDCETNLA